MDLPPRWFPPLLLAIAIGAAYSNGLDVPFAFDDWHTIEQNPAIRELGRVPAYFVDPDTTTVLHENKDLRPLLLVTMAFNYQVSALAPWSYHVVNLILHWLVALLVFRIVRDHLWLGAEGPPIGLAAALIVALHPLNTEPVNYVSARSALLTAAFYLGAFDAACRDRRVLCVILAACAMLTKSIAISLPVIVLVHWLFDRRRPLPWGLLAALVVVAVGGILYRWYLLPPWVVASAHQADVTPRIYFQTQWSALLYYLRLFAWPDALVVDRLDFPWARSLRDVQAWGSLLALAALAVVARLLTRIRPAFGFCALWVVITLAPESSVFPLAEAVNEHRPYLAMLGLATITALVLWLAAGAVARRLVAPRGWVFAVVVTFVATLLGAAAHARTEVWRDDLTLWVDATKKAPRNPRAWLNAGHAALARGDLADARQWLLEAHRLSPCYAYVQINLSALESRQGDERASLRWADEAVRCNPGLALARAHRAATLERLGRTDDALAEFEETTRIDPAHAGAWLAQGKLLEARAQWAQATDAYEHALLADPTSVEAAMRSGLLLHYRLGDSATAVERYRTVLALDPAHYGAHYQLAVALLGAGRRDEALAAWARFVPLAEAIGDRTSIDAAPAELRGSTGRGAATG